MLRKNVENKSNAHDQVELSRRGFFSRFAVGAILSIGMPTVVNAAKTAADKGHKQAKSSRSAVRLPKQVATQASKAGRQTSVLASHNNAAGKKQQVIAANSRKSPALDHGHIRTAHTERLAQHNNRVHDRYTGKNHPIHMASHQHNGRYQRNSKAQSIIQPIQNEPMDDSVFLASHGRYATHRALAIQNPHTGDKLSLTYFEKGRYLSDALEEISFLLRDYRTGDVHPIDPELLDQLYDLKQILSLNQPFDIICGYRSPMTNAQLHAEHSGVASNSFHIHGRAVDIRIERFDLRRIHNAALAMHRGGVGYYPGSNFIHLDTGSFRTWAL